MASLAQRTDIIYSDTDNDYTVHPVSGDIILLTNENAVKRSIRNLILTDKGERPYNPDVGSGLRHMLFEPITPVTETMIAESIRETIENYEPRAELKSVNVSADPDSQSYAATIIFSIINILDPLTLTVILQRIR